MSRRVWSSGYDARFTRERSGVRPPLPVLILSNFFGLINYYFNKSFTYLSILNIIFLKF